MREPWFWRDTSITGRALSTVTAPLGKLYNAVQQYQWTKTTSLPTPIPVICIGNASLGGVGKTPFARWMREKLSADSENPAIVTRGYGGTVTGPLRVDPKRHVAADVGDEAVMLAKDGACFVSRSRYDGVVAAASAGFDVALLDDGHQNQSIEKAVSLLLVDNADPEGNGQVFPAGPMREPLQQAANRADAIVSIKRAAAEPYHEKIKAIATDRLLFSAWLNVVSTDIPERTIGFCGIGRPERFFTSLRKTGTNVISTHSFGDHHPFSRVELNRLKNAAIDANATLVTTEKDFSRLSPDDRADLIVLKVELQVNREEFFLDFIRSSINEHASRSAS